MSATADSVESRDGRYTRHEDRRRELMDGAINYVFTHGLSKLSIRPMAEALGISHRTLLHHFGSKDEMIARILEEVRTRELQALKRRTLDVLDDPVKIVETAWEYVTSSEMLAYSRSFFEIYGIALNDPERYQDFLDSVVNAWQPMLAKAIARWGIAEEKAGLYASILQASMRGLIIDLLTTGDDARVQASFNLFRDMLRRELDAPRQVS